MDYTAYACMQHSGLWSPGQVQGWVHTERAWPHHYQDFSSLQTPLSATVCQSVIAFLPQSVTLMFSFIEIICSIPLSSLLLQAMVCVLACSALTSSLDPENCVFLLMRKMAI